MKSTALTQQSLVRRLGRALTMSVLAIWLLSTALVAWFVDSQIQENFDIELWRVRIVSCIQRF